MTAIVGLFGMHAHDSEALARAALSAMHPRGRECVELWHDDNVTLGAVSERWETGAEGASTPRLAVDAGAAVVTDASLYYVADLRRALGAAWQWEVAESPASLVLAAYHVWGERFLERIEGDFALVLWDRRARKVLAARDHTGGRTLFYASPDQGLAVASRLDGLTSLPGFDTTLDELAIADDALFLRVNNQTGTAYRAVRRVPAGHALTWHPATTPIVNRWWDVPVFLRGDGPPFDEALEELRALVVAAVEERARHPGGSAIWLSGGYDSSTLFAASHIAAASRGSPPLHPVSMSHPPGDPGREDELIELSTSFWHVTPTWVNVDDVPALADPVDAARARDEPFYHTYELSNRALAQATRAAGLRAAIVGNGGDQFFSAGVARLADHFRAGRLATLAREWREAGGGRDWRLFLRAVVIPNLTPRFLLVADRLRHTRTTQQRLVRTLPTWTNREFGQLGVLEEMNRAGLERRKGEGHAAFEQGWFLRHVTGERINAAYTATGLLDGVELRSPLLDARIARYAASRPLEESYSRGENKRLLRAAFAGSLPEPVLARRQSRTGLPQRSLLRTASEHARWVTGACGKGMILADLRVIDGSKFLESARQLAASSGRADVEDAAAFVACTQVECWLRARS